MTPPRPTSSSGSRPPATRPATTTSPTTTRAPRTAPVLSIVGGPSYASGFQFQAPTSLDPGDNKDVTAALTAVDLKVPSPGGVYGSTSGCEAADFAGFPAGNIALVQRGTCDFVVKIANAIAAGASAIVIMNEGDTPARSGLAGFNPATTGNIPVLAATTAVGNELRNGVLNGATGRTIRVKVDLITIQNLPTRNVVAQTPGRSDNVIVVGAHLDSVDDGPEQKADIAGMLNFDLLASPNFVRFVYDGDLSSFPGPVGGVPAASAAIEKIFNDYFAAQGLPTAPTAFDGRSDYRAFIQNGIPAGGLFTGAEVRKSPEQAAIYGGAAGEQFDPCYHAFCDTLETPTGAPPAIALANPASAGSLGRQRVRRPRPDVRRGRSRDDHPRPVLRDAQRRAREGQLQHGREDRRAGGALAPLGRTRQLPGLRAGSAVVCRVRAVSRWVA